MSNNFIVKGMFYMQHAIEVTHDELVKEFERKVKEKKIFFEVTNPNVESKGVNVSDIVTEYNRLKKELRYWQDIVASSISSDAKRGRNG